MYSSEGGLALGSGIAEIRSKMCDMDTLFLINTISLAYGIKWYNIYIS